MRTLTSYPHNKYRRKTTRRSEQGQSFLEFAFILPALFLMLLGVTVISQGVNIQMVLYGAAYEGARVWAKDPAGGGGNNCTPPACDPAAGTSVNFEKYVIPVVRQYVTNNGYDGSKVMFFAEDQAGYQKGLTFYSDKSEFVRVLLIYPYELPIGSFGGKYQKVSIRASCAMKRGG